MDRRMAMAAAGLAATLPYLPSLSYYFVQDDFGVVSLLASKPAGYFPRWFVSTWMDDIWGYTPDEIRPFPALSYQVAAAFGAGSPVANHVINIAFHAANTLLVLGLAARVAGLALGSSMFAALVFALLPMQTESVAWITGRVDSMPACAYMAAVLLYARWRDSGDGWTYAGAVVVCFVALFTKQNAVTLLPALAASDLIVRRQEVKVSWARARPYVPFLLLTAGYLLLRYVLFGEVARESMLGAERVALFLGDLSVHLRRMVFGDVGLVLPSWLAALTVATAGLVLGLMARRTSDSAPAGRLRPAVYFGPVWIGLAAAPTLVAGYASPRHMYLASAGWAVLLGLAFDVFWRDRPARAVRRAGIALAALVLAGYGWQLAADLRTWERRAHVSRRAVADVEREALAAPPGTLVIAGAPRQSWAFALPHSLRPPFTQVDLLRRVRVISLSPLSCCPYFIWERETRQALAEWNADPTRPPVVAMHWDPETARLSRLSDREDAVLGALARMLADRPTPVELDRMIREIVERYVPGRVAGTYQ